MGFPPYTVADDYAYAKFDIAKTCDDTGNGKELLHCCYS